MADIGRMGPGPTRAQVREYVLTMLEGLAGLAESVQDQHTRDRVRDFADHLVMSWSSRPEAADHPEAPAVALGERVASGSAGVNGRPR
jgi:hypothetical protein